MPHLDATLREVGITPLREVSPRVDDGLGHGTVQRMILVAHGPPLLRYHKTLVNNQANAYLGFMQRQIGLNRQFGVRHLLSRHSPLSQRERLSCLSAPAKLDMIVHLIRSEDIRKVHGMRGTLQARRRDVEAEPASKSDRILHLTSPATLQKLRR